MMRELLALVPGVVILYVGLFVPLDTAAPVDTRVESRAAPVKWDQLQPGWRVKVETSNPDFFPGYYDFGSQPAPTSSVSERMLFVHSVTTGATGDQLALELYDIKEPNGAYGWWPLTATQAGGRVFTRLVEAP